MNHGGTILTILTERLWEFYEGNDRSAQDGTDGDGFGGRGPPLYSVATGAGRGGFYGKQHMMGGPGMMGMGGMGMQGEMGMQSYANYPRARGKFR